MRNNNISAKKERDIFVIENGKIITLKRESGVPVDLKGFPAIYFSGLAEETTGDDYFPVKWENCRGWKFDGKCPLTSNYRLVDKRGEMRFHRKIESLKMIDRFKNYVDYDEWRKHHYWDAL